MGSSHSGGDTQPHEPYQRRQICKNINIPIEKGIQCLTEYVECPRGNLLFTKCFIPDKSIISKPKGLICQAIGYTAYSDYDFTIIAQSYAKKGYVFFIWDHDGHGRSSGLWIDISIKNMVNDTIFICNYAQKKYPLPNNYLFGTSMGGNVVTRTIIEIQQNVDTHKHKDFCSKQRWSGIVLFAPMVGVNRNHTYNALGTYFIEHWLAYYWPKAILLSKTVGKDIYAYSRDKEMAEFMSQNPLIFPFGPRPKTGVELIKTAQFVQDNLEVMGDTDIPLLVFHGTADDVTESSMSLKMVESVSQRQLNKDATHRLMDQALHGLMVDKCRDEVLNEAVEWMDNHNK